MFFDDSVPPCTPSSSIGTRKGAGSGSAPRRGRPPPGRSPRPSGSPRGFWTPSPPLRCLGARGSSDARSRDPADDGDDSRARRPNRRSVQGAPNVMVIVCDDLGFAHLGSYGSDLLTPNLDRLAARGLRFTNFHTTAVCSPTRACLLTGRNHHRVGMGMLPDLPTNFPAYSGRIPRVGGNARADPARRRLRDVLCRQVASRPARSARHRPVRHVADRPRLRPLLRVPQRRDEPVDAEPRPRHEPRRAAARHPTTATTSTPTSPTTRSPTCASCASRIPHRPFLLWYASAAPHAPHQAPPEWIDRFRGRFDDGWDAWRDATLARQIELGIVPEGTQLLGAPAVDRGVVRRSTRRAVVCTRG